jgi:hypothetical protein
MVYPARALILRLGVRCKARPCGCVVSLLWLSECNIVLLVLDVKHPLDLLPESIALFDHVA